MCFTCGVDSNRRPRSRSIWFSAARRSGTLSTRVPSRSKTSRNPGIEVQSAVPTHLAKEARQLKDGMATRLDACLAFTLRKEGGYVDDPADPGGATNMGITLATYRQWSDNPELGSTQVQDMTERTARAISRSSARIGSTVPRRGAMQRSR